MEGGKVNTEPQGAPRCLSGRRPDAEVLRGVRKAGKLLQEDTGSREVTVLREVGRARGEGGWGSPINMTVVLKLCSRLLYDHSWVLLTALRGRQNILVTFMSQMRRREQRGSNSCSAHTAAYGRGVTRTLSCFFLPRALRYDWTHEVNFGRNDWQVGFNTYGGNSSAHTPPQRIWERQMKRRNHSRLQRLIFFLLPFPPPPSPSH